MNHKRTSLALAPFQVDKPPPDPNKTLSVEVNVTAKNKYEILVSLGELKWHAQISHSQLSSFHNAIQQNFESLLIPELPEKTKCAKEPLLIRCYLISILRYESIRLSPDILKLIGIQCKIAYDVPEYMRTYQENWRAPLSTQPPEIREAIGHVMIFFYQGWKSYELARYIDNADAVYTNTNHILRVSRQTKKYFDAVMESIFSRLDLPVPSTNTLESSLVTLDNDIFLLSQLDEKFKWAIVWELLLQALMNKSLDSRVHISVQLCALLLGLSLEDLSIAEQECSSILQRQLVEMRKQEIKNASRNRALKIGAGAAVGGGVMFLAGLITLPLLLPAMVSGFGTAAGLAAAAPIAGASLAAGVAAAGALATSVATFLPLLFGAMGAGLVGYKISNVTEGISEFRFVRVPVETENSQISEEDICPAERFCIDFESGTIIDQSTGHKYEATGDKIDFGRIAELLNRAATSSGYKSEENGIQAEQNETSKQKKQRKANEKLDQKLKQTEATLSGSDSSALSPEETEVIESAGMEVFIAINGWLWDEQEVTTNFCCLHDLHPGAEIYSLRWQTEQINRLGKFIVAFVTDEALGQLLEAIIAALSVTAAAVLAALAIPMYLLTASVLIDNPWTLVSNHARRAGKLLANVLVARAAGRRPVSLLGWSHGARVIFYALEYMNKMDNEDYRGIIQNVFLIGSPITSKKKRWEAVRPLVAGRMVNCYSEADWLLPIIHRAATGKSKSVAGVMKIDLSSVENIDLTNIVGGHLSYARNLKKIFELLDLSNSVAVSFAHRLSDKKVLSNIPDACIKQLSFESKRKEENENKLRKQKKQENSFSSKLSKQVQSLKQQSPKNISSPILMSQQRKPGYHEFRNESPAKTQTSSPRTYKTLPSSPGRPLQASSPPARTQKTNRNITQPTKVTPKTIKQNPFITNDKETNKKSSKPNTKRVVRSSTAPSLPKPKKSGTSMISKLKTSFSGSQPTSPVVTKKTTKIASNPFVLNDKKN